MRVAMIVLCVVALAAAAMSAGMPADKGNFESRVRHK